MYVCSAAIQIIIQKVNRIYRPVETAIIKIQEVGVVLF